MVLTEFLADEEARDMYITGGPGTGKTTSLSVDIQYCIDQEIPYVVCAYTHTACNVLRSKLPPGANIMTLHAYLTKRPTINDKAQHIDHLETSIRCGDSEKYNLLWVDEFSAIGEADHMDIGRLQDEFGMKVVYIGDVNQLPPVGDIQSVQPSGKYHKKLTHVWRQAGDNQLLDTIYQILALIEDRQEDYTGLVEHDTFKRGFDLAKVYRPGDMLLAYTNARVEELNRIIANKSAPNAGDNLFSPTLRITCDLDCITPGFNVWQIQRAYGADPLLLGSKYKTLEHLVRMECCEFYEVLYEEAEETVTHAVVFGHYRYKLAKQKYANAAVEANSNIPDDNPAQWARENHTSPLAKARAKAWRDYLTFKDCVVCMDFPYAMTVHKSQGSTYDTVLLDTEDLYKCAARNYKLYLKLMYVGISRASNKVYTS